MVDLPPQGLPSNAFCVPPVVYIPIPLVIVLFLVYNEYSEDALPTNPTFEPSSRNLGMSPCARGIRTCQSLSFESSDLFLTL